MRYILLGISLTLISFSGLTKEAGCFPESNQRYPIMKTKANHLSEAEFNAIIDHFKKVFTPYVKERTGKTLKVEPKWKEERVNAFCTRDMEDNPLIVFNGGMARHPEMTHDGIVTILCHELGHYIGGAPKSFRGRSQRRSWSSAEGQADYFATSKCLPLYFAGINHNDVYNYSYIRSDNDKGLCQTDLCQRISLAGLSVSRVFASLKNGRMPELENRDGSKVVRTNHAHPSPQCRLDTMLAGAICDQDPLGNFDNEDPRVSACIKGLGSRPSCWYNPERF